MSNQQTFTTKTGITVTYQKTNNPMDSLTHITDKLDRYKGMMMSSGIEYPGRYNRWELGFYNPPVEVIAYQNEVVFNALNPRGCIILALFTPVLIKSANLVITKQTTNQIRLKIISSDKRFSEEERSLKPSVATPLRLINEEMHKLKDNMLGFFGGFGYDLIFVFEPPKQPLKRPDNTKLYHLFFADHIFVIDKQKAQSFTLSLEFSKEDITTNNSATEPFEHLKPQNAPFQAQSNIDISLPDEEYTKLVEKAQNEMKKGNIFEIVYSRHFSAKVSGSAAMLYQKLKEMNPSPYEFYCQFGDEQLVGTSPEMFVRCEGDIVESCPISGTVKRGKNAMEDEKQIRQLLNSYKDEVELTMCTDVDRNDKARICEPGSIELIARRTIERYVGLFHTVDHVKGKLRPGFNGLDAFLSHMWAVTLTGSPKKRAIELIEATEKKPRNWYGGAVGCLGFNGDINSTITIRTVHLKENMAYYQAGATLVWDSNPKDEAEETRTKATTFYKALGQFKTISNTNQQWVKKDFSHINAIMIDHEDSFVHTLASYFRQLGVKLSTYRYNVISTDEIIAQSPDLVIYSPGPGTPNDFDLPKMVQTLTQNDIPQFGVCLGLQGIFEAFGGKLSLLDNPRHGKTWQLKHNTSFLFDGIQQNAEVAAYHSIIADKSTLPQCLEISAFNEHGDIMAITHKTKPVCAVQFHPESILTSHDDTGLKLVQNSLLYLCAEKGKNT
ncbi:anthranilate synthase component I [Facilibium subflavum]|uniref:anthranilate synthase component I n=1 Tax=Facilibium subflavum TaxID=2219058 RepID=UPI0013C2C6EB|nr:anthranilate synthase component I [Facilibium subflavum]